MNRITCARLIKQHLNAKDIVVCGLGSVEAAYKEIVPAGPCYFASDPMGLWPSVALGLALARRDRRVVLLAGDGDLLMNLPILVTIAAVAPANLRIILFQNGSYASSGGQLLGSSDRMSFATVAKGAGFSNVFEAQTEDGLSTALAQLFDGKELGFVAAHVERDLSPSEPPGPWAQAELRAMFMQSLDAQGT